jgi:SAM-dependent methyltransferase
MTDYDRTDIPGGYDRGRDHGPEVLALYLTAMATHLGDRTPATILDLGCGTGRFTDAMAVHFNADVLGLDPSVKMLAVARAKRHAGRVRYVLARAEAIPLAPGSLDVVFMSMSFHHFSDQRLAAAECRRVLRARGAVFVRTGTREQITSYPYYPFFPSSHPIMEEVLPDRTILGDVFKAAGFQLVGWNLIRQTIAPSWQAYADKLATGADSVLARLSPKDFEGGLAAIREYAARATTQTVVEPIDLFVFTSADVRQTVLYSPV